MYIQQLRIPPPCRFAKQRLLQLLVGRSACLLLFVCLWVRIRRTAVTLVAGRSVCASAFVCLPLVHIFRTFFADLGFRGAPWGHIEGTWTLKMTALVPHLASGGPGDRFLVNLGYIFKFGSHFGHHFGHWRSLVTTFASFRHPFFNDVFGTLSGTCPGRANVAKTFVNTVSE